MVLDVEKDGLAQIGLEEDQQHRSEVTDKMASGNDGAR
jgi:hypothetical protein